MYEAFYGLSELPFELTANPKFLYLSAGQREALSTLEMTVVEGIKTSIPLHLKVLADPDYVAGRISTSFMERYMPEKQAAMDKAAAERQASA